MDEKLESLRRALREDPQDLSSALRLASGLEKTGAFDEAWALLDERGLTEALAALAARNPRAVLARIRGLDYRRARLFMERLEAIGQGNNPALVAVASESDRVLGERAARIVARALGAGLPELRDTTPDDLRSLVEGRLPSSVPPGEATVERRERWRGLVQKLIERSGTKQAALFLPWLVPLLTAGEPVLAARALALVRRLTDRDGPPFDPELLARLLARRDAGKNHDEGEAA